MVAKWLEERWQMLIPALEKLDESQEEEIQALCKAELRAWRNRPSMTTLSSLQAPLAQTRNRFRQIPLTRENRWLNPKTGSWEHLALKYLNFSQEEWMQMQLPSEEHLQLRLAQRLLLREPQAIVQRGEYLLQASFWPEQLLGIVVNTGRSIAEVLKTGRFAPKTAYSLLFEGPQKRQDRRVAPFELPTLSPASLVMEALTRVRTVLDCSLLEKQQVSRRYGSLVREAAYRHFLGLVPLPAEEHDLYKQLFLSVYPRLAFYFYCPAEVSEITYMATIRGHQYLLEADTAEQRLKLATVAQYFDYVIVDSDGTIDERRGMRLGSPDVEVLEVFKKQILSEGDREEAEESFAEFPVVSPPDLLITLETRERVDRIARELGNLSDDETLVMLLAIDAQRQEVFACVNNWLKVQLNDDQPGAALEGKSAPSDPLAADKVINDLIDSYELHPYALKLYQYQRLLDVLLPLSGEFETTTPLGILQVLITAYWE